MRGAAPRWTLLALAPILVSVALQSCAAKQYRVCAASGDVQVCRGGYSRRDAKVAAETLGSLPGVDRAWTGLDREK